jgi:hypothetical protein
MNLVHTENKQSVVSRELKRSAVNHFAE